MGFLIFFFIFFFYWRVLFHKPSRFVLWDFYRAITIVRGFHCAIKTNVLPHSLITGTLKTPNKTKHSVLKITEESLKLEHPALENVRYEQAGWTSAIYMTSFFYNRTCQNEDIRGAAYHQIHSASEKSPFSVKIHEVCNHDFSIKRCSFCDEVAQREASDIRTFLPHTSNLSQSWWPNILTVSSLHLPISNETTWHLHLSQQKPKHREVSCLFPL